ncbi:MAG: hypothetical protein Cons2KO_30340 [Congregibacter sp.]
MRLIKALRLVSLLIVTAFAFVRAEDSDPITSVSSAAELFAAIVAANSSGFAIIELAPGDYRLTQPLRIEGDFITLRSANGDREATVLRGNGMKPGNSVDNLIEVSGSHVAIQALTLRDAGNHLVQLRGEKNADYFSLINCALIDAYEQLLKVSAERGSTTADFGLIKDSFFGYTKDQGPNYYIGGIDVHGGKNWIVEKSTFRNIASPSRSVAEFAIHFWSGSDNPIVRNNRIIDSDRGIGFGLGEDPSHGNTGGEISGNLIVHNRKGDPFSDVGISLENSPGTRVTDNFVQLEHAYPNAIEYRFPGTVNVLISGNSVNRAIASRDAAEATVEANHTASKVSMAWDFLAYVFHRVAALVSSD